MLAFMVCTAVDARGGKNQVEQKEDASKKDVMTCESCGYRAHHVPICISHCIKCGSSKTYRETPAEKPERPMCQYKLLKPATPAKK